MKRPRSERGGRPVSLAQELLELGRDLVQRRLRGQLVVVEDVRVELILERGGELVVAAERRLEVSIGERVGEVLPPSNEVAYVSARTCLFAGIDALRLATMACISGPV